MQGEYAQLLYHLNLHNVSQRKLTLKRIELESLDSQGRLLSRTVLAEELLRRRLRPVGWIVMRDRQTIAAAHRYRGMLRRPKGDTVIPPQDVVSLTRQVVFERPESLPRVIRFVAVHSAGRSTAELEVLTFHQRTALRLPVQGRWWVMGGHRFDDHHGSGVLSSQNFAYDLGVMGNEQNTCDGDPSLNSSYLASGRPIVAAADGEVVRVHDGVAENTPVGRRPTWQSILQNPLDLAGNHVVVRHAEGEFSAYMHLRPGIKVQPGQRVRQGQPLGLCGNSGNSLETHLHFQFQDGPDPLRANGLPVRFGDFTVLWAHLRLYVPADRPKPLPVRLGVEPGRASGAVELERVLRYDN
jgi:hypothetical protein